MTEWLQYIMNLIFKGKLPCKLLPKWSFGIMAVFS